MKKLNAINARILLLILAHFFSSQALAGVSVETSIDGLVIKELRCIVGDLRGNIINRTDQEISTRKAFVKVFDRDGDPIGSCSGKLALAPLSGDRFAAKGCNCDDAASYKVAIEEKEY